MVVIVLTQVFGIRAMIFVDTLPETKPASSPLKNGWGWKMDRFPFGDGHPFRRFCFSFQGWQPFKGRKFSQFRTRKLLMIRLPLWQF